MSSSKLSSNCFDLLPPESKRHIASFLHPRDSRRLRSETVLGIPPIVDLFRAQLIDTGFYCESSDEPIRAISIFIPERRGVQTHSLELSFTWCAGNQSGRIYIVQEKIHQDEPPDLSAPFAGGISVCETQDAPPQKEKRCRLIWHPACRSCNIRCSGHQYSVWYKAERSTGKKLRLENLSLTTYIFDDSSRSYSKTFSQLDQLGALRSTRRWHHGQCRFEEFCQQFIHAQPPQSSSVGSELVAPSQASELDVQVVHDILKHEILLQDVPIVAAEVVRRRRLPLYGRAPRIPSLTRRFRGDSLDEEEEEEDDDDDNLVDDEWAWVSAFD